MLETKQTANVLNKSVLCVYNAIFKFIYCRSFKISRLKTVLLFNKIYLGGW